MIWFAELVSEILSDSPSAWKSLEGCRWNTFDPIYGHIKALEILTQHEAEAITNSKFRDQQCKPSRLKCGHNFCQVWFPRFHETAFSLHAELLLLSKVLETSYSGFKNELYSPRQLSFIPSATKRIPKSIEVRLTSIPKIPDS